MPVVSPGFPGGTFFGGSNSDPMNPGLVKNGGQIKENQPEIPFISADKVLLTSSPFLPRLSMPRELVTYLHSARVPYRKQNSHNRVLQTSMQNRDIKRI